MFFMFMYTQNDNNMIKQWRFNEETFQIVIYFNVTNHKSNTEAFWLESDFWAPMYEQQGLIL